MVKVKNIGLTDFERRDPLWWCQHYKGLSSTLRLRAEQYVNAEDDDRKKTLETLLQVLFDYCEGKGIGIVLPYEDEEDEKEDE
tara:strand:- start:1487 stop:1735 length:249 start_codon:yes stop_codon:yes gene_type:complete